MASPSTLRAAASRPGISAPQPTNSAPLAIAMLPGSWCESATTHTLAFSRRQLVRVERVNERLVAGVDHSALHLERRRELATLDGKVGVQQSDFLRRLELRQAGELLEHLLVHLGPHQRVGEELPAIGEQDVLDLGPLLELLEVGHD